MTVSTFDGGGPAYPVATWHPNLAGPQHDPVAHMAGMSLWDVYASHALTAAAAIARESDYTSDELSDDDVECTAASVPHVARIAAELADALLEERAARIAQSKLHTTIANN